MRKYYLAGVAGLALAFACSQANAQQVASESSRTTVEELVVTARKREERLFDVPGPVTAITGAQVNDLRVNDARQLVTLIPTGFLQEVNAGTARDINIRGVGTPTLFAESGVATYVDDVYSSSFISYPTQFYDLERVEVLRGPQGGLYGQDAVGGAVNFISHRPTAETGGYLRAAYGNWDRYELEAMGNLPLGDRSGVRAVAWRTEQDKGEYYNSFLHDWIDKNDTLGGRVAFQSRLTDTLTVNLIAEAQKANTPGTNLYFPDSGETKTSIQRDTQPTNHFDVVRLAGQLDWDAGTAGHVTFVGGYRNYNLNGTEDTDLSAVAAAKTVLTRDNSVNATYAELRWLSPDFGPVSVLAGVSYIDAHGVGDIFSNSVGLTGLIGAPALLSINNDQQATSWAPWAEATWRLTSTLSLIADLRYTSDKKSDNFAFTPSPAFTAVVPSFVPQALNTSKTFTHTSPGVTLAWTPDADWRVYGKVQSGFRAGGFNFNVARAADLAYDSETSVNYEIGAKRRIPGGFVAATAFLLHQDKVLTPEFDLLVPGPTGSFLANLGKARTYGLELEADVQPLDGLHVTGNIGLLDAKFTEGEATFFGSLKGKELPTARPFTAALTANYRRPVASDIDLLLNGAYTHRNAGWGDAANTFRLDASDLMNLSAGLDLHHRYEVLLYVDNLLDSDNIIAFGGFRPPNSTGILRAPGRSYGVSLKASF